MNTQNLNLILKWVGTVSAFAVWGYFAYIGKTPVDGFVTALTGAVSGVSLHAVLKGGSSNGSSPQNPVAPPPQA
jgi:hypothetical protein